jgi:hypothetical protein
VVNTQKLRDGDSRQIAGRGCGRG